MVIPILHWFLFQVNCLKFSDDGKLLAVTGYEVLRVYDVHSNSPLTVMSNNPDKNSKNITCVAFDRTESTRLITGIFCFHLSFDSSL